MSSLTKPVTGVGGTPVDPGSPGGILIDPTTEISGSPTLDEVIKGDGLGGWTVGLLPAATEDVAGVAEIATPTETNTGTDDTRIVTPLKLATYTGPFPLKRLLLEFSTDGGVPNGGTRYLDRVGIACTSVPVLLPAAATLIGLTIVVDSADGARTYEAEVVSDPAGAPVLIGSALTLATGTTSNSRRDLSATIGAGVLWGVRARRSAGTGPSSFSNLRIEVEVQMP